MATRLKTVQYAFPMLASLADNSLTTLTQITVYLPESSLAFKSVTAVCRANDIITATGGTWGTRTLNLRVGAAAYTSVSNTNAYTHSGENMAGFFSGDYTAHFTANWSGSSMTCDCQVLIDQTTGTTLGLVDVSVLLTITYEYDDTSSTHVKTVWIPLDAPTGALATSKPGTPTATIPALDTYLPERDKAYRQMWIVRESNESNNTGTTTHTVSMQIDSLTAYTSGNHVAALASDRATRDLWGITGLGMTTNATHSFYIWASLALENHPQCYLVVTYEFSNGGPVTTAWSDGATKSIGDKVYGTNNIAFICTTGGTTGGSEPTWNTTAGSTTADNTVTWTVLSARQSLWLPLLSNSPMGGTTSSDYNRMSRDLYIEEPGSIESVTLCGMPFWDQTGGIAGLNFRLGTGSFVGYTDVASVMAGGNMAMVRNDSAFTLARGKNTLTMDVYRTDATDIGYSVGGFIIANYISAQHKDGQGAHNHTVIWNLWTTGTVASGIIAAISATGITIPETSYFMPSCGYWVLHSPNNSSGPGGVNVNVERLDGEGGLNWETIGVDTNNSDAENGVRNAIKCNDHLFKRWPGDVNENRIDMETSRRWWVMEGNGSSTFFHFDMFFNYHAMEFAVSGTVTGSGGGTVNLTARRVATGEIIGTASRSGDGTYSIPWYDNTENVMVEAVEDATHLGRSADGVAA